ncbi:MAG TPA: small ribosomal subunit biogenesis GTPase RsgA [Candidatus Competibacteraceae bacterium]|nr:small ribosomal subunit biogenesis GTPase RsgA [Candidatus Competibacteraceae bacterium]
MARRRLSQRQLERIRKLQEQRRSRAARRASREHESGPLGAEQPGLVLANFGPHLIVEDERGGLWRCAVRQNLGTVVCGDRVIWQPAAAGGGVVVAVEPRRSLLARGGYGGRPKPIAANLDQVLVVLAPMPVPTLSLIDRYLVAIERLGVNALLILNKSDLLDAKSATLLDELLGVYERIGYRLVRTSTRSAAGLAPLRRALAGHTSILVGQSGVGKSSLIKALLPQREIRTQAISAATGLGTHATTTTTLYHLPDGGDLIDSPGVRSFELEDLDQTALDRGFREFAPYLGQCRFSNCGHRVEPGCALREAVARGELDERRLESYLQLKDGLKPEY